MNKLTPALRADWSASLFFLSFLLTGTFSLIACRTPPTPTHESARSTFSSFRNEVMNESYSSAYQYLSEDTKKRYTLNEFHGLLEKTRAGRLLRWKLKNWTIREVRRTGENRAYVILADPNDKHRNRYELVRVSTERDRQAWRLRFYISDEMNIPRSDERMLFSNTEEQ